MSKLKFPFVDTHLFRLTDCTGMFQHAKYSLPDLLHGYTTDDNVRALLLAALLFEDTEKPAYLELIYRYLSFVRFAQNPGGRFRNFMTYDRQFTETEGSEDCFGRCLWVLAYIQSSSAMPVGIKKAAQAAIQQALPAVADLIWPRGQAYAIIGLGLLEDQGQDDLIGQLAAALADRFDQVATGADWQWFEDQITYDNAALPWALFVAYKRLGQERLLRVAQSSLSFLNKVIFRAGYFQPVGCNGWYVRGLEPAKFDEQGLEACTSVLCHLAAYRVTGDRNMLKLAHKSFDWYGGDNSAKASLIDNETGGCFDGITASGVNLNQGAESIISYGIARTALSQVAKSGQEIKRWCCGC